ncbi:hypothetical protein BRADI_2g25765v3, partial [Brachypodium distachyon]
MTGAATSAPTPAVLPRLLPLCCHRAPCHRALRHVPPRPLTLRLSAAIHDDVDFPSWLHVKAEIGDTDPWLLESAVLARTFFSGASPGHYYGVRRRATARGGETRAARGGSRQRAETRAGGQRAAARSSAQTRGWCVATAGRLLAVARGGSEDTRRRQGWRAEAVKVPGGGGSRQRAETGPACGGDGGGARRRGLPAAQRGRRRWMHRQKRCVARGEREEA